MEIERKKSRKRKVIKAMLVLAAVIVCVLFFVCHFILQFPELRNNPVVGKWYRVSRAEMMSSDGSEWHGFFKPGAENKVLVYFEGGGVSVDEHTASAMGFFKKDQDWMDRFNRFVHNNGIGSQNIENPFCGWTVIVIPYSTGDFHIGTGEYIYTDEDGKEQILYHNGYINYSALMNAVMPYIETPDALVVAGFSAGGFGASMLADDLISRYFYDVSNKTVLVDSALLLYNNWQEVAKNHWNAPGEIVDRMTTDNITLDHLIALHEKYGDEVKILFDCSIRDGELAKFQSYLNGGAFEADEEAGDVVQENLKNMVQTLTKTCGAGIYIWDGYGYNDGEMDLTQHAIINDPYFYTGRPDGERSVADWVMDAVNGELCNRGGTDGYLCSTCYDLREKAGMEN